LELTKMSELPPKHETLVRVLAHVNATFGPWPNPDSCNAACFEKFTRQDHYLDRGIPWRTGGSADERKRGQRVLDELVQDGLVHVQKGVGQHRRVTLTELGDDYARSLLNHCRLVDSWDVFVAMVASARAQARHGYWRLSQIAEALGGNETSTWHELYPLLARGYVSGTTGTAGVALFTILPERWEAADGPAPALLAEPDPDERLTSVYWDTIDQVEAEKPNWRPSRDGCVFIPTLA
jgi:hypothetical protein